MAYVSFHFLFYLQFNLKDPSVYILPYIHLLQCVYAFYVRFIEMVTRARFFLCFYACKSMPRKKKGKKMQENPRTFSEIDRSSFVDKIHLTKRKLRNWERISRVELCESQVTFNEQTIRINTVHTDYYLHAFPGQCLQPQSHSNLTLIITQHGLHEITHSYHCIFTDHKHLLIIIIMNNYQLPLLNKQVCVKI